MLETATIETENHPRSNALDSFVTRIWMHPLLTEKTKQKRAEALRVLQERYGNLKNIAIIPVGSLIWISRDQSDVDCLVFSMGGDEAQLQEISTFLDSNRASRKEHDPTQPIFHYIMTCDFGEVFEFRSVVSELARLFLIPDEFIIGDISMIRSLRIKALSQVNYHNAITDFSVEDDFWEEINADLNRTKQWPTRSFGSKHGSYFPRFIEALVGRSAKSKRPSKWISQFYHALTKLHPPEFDVIKASIINASGAIHIDNRQKVEDLT